MARYGCLWLPIDPHCTLLYPFSPYFSQLLPIATFCSLLPPITPYLSQSIMQCSLLLPIAPFDSLLLHIAPFPFLLLPIDPYWSIWSPFPSYCSLLIPIAPICSLLNHFTLYWSLSLPIVSIDCLISIWLPISPFGSIQLLFAHFPQWDESILKTIFRKSTTAPLLTHLCFVFLSIIGHLYFSS